MVNFVVRYGAMRMLGTRVDYKQSDTIDSNV